jgi:drug/metabolite transporter (DMT)-like permease
LKREGRSIIKIIGVGLAVTGSISMIVITAIVEKSEGGDNNGKFQFNVNLKSLMGCALMVLNSMCTAVYVILQKTLLDRKVPPVTVTGWSLIVACIISCFVSIYYFITDFHPASIPTSAWIGLLYAGTVIGTVSFSMVAFAAKIVSPTVTSVYSTTSPIVSSIFLYVFLGQITTPYAIIGGILITAGVFMVAYAKRRESQQAEQEAKKAAELKQIIQQEEMDEVPDTLPLSESMTLETTEINSKNDEN